MANNEDDTNKASSMQLLDLLEKEIVLMREILSEYAAEEKLLLKGEFGMLKEIHTKRSELKKMITQIRMQKKRAEHPEETGELCDHHLLHNQIQALNSEIIDKIALVKNLHSLPKKKEEKKGERGKIAIDEELET